MFGELIQYWFLTGDSTYNQVVFDGLQFQVGENKDFMPRNRTRELVRAAAKMTFTVVLWSYFC